MDGGRATSSGGSEADTGFLRLERGTPAGQPLIPPAPRSAMFFPLVVLVAVLPGMYALNWWDLHPPGPRWGLRALAVLEGYRLDQVPAFEKPASGSDSDAVRQVSLQPPLFAWLEAVGLAIAPARAPWGCVAPSVAAGALLVLLVYWHGRLWRGPGVAVTAAALTGFNNRLIGEMQISSPATLVAALATAVLFCRGRHLRFGTGPTRARPWGGGVGWIFLGGLCLGLGLLTLGGFVLLTIPIILLHHVFLRAEPREGPREHHREPWGDTQNLTAGLVALIIGLAAAAPWHVLMYSRYGASLTEALASPNEALAGDRPDVLTRLLDLAPATLPLAALAAARAIRHAVVSREDDLGAVGGAFWFLWLGVAILTPSLWPGAPSAAIDLFLLVPLNLLAAQAVADLSWRRIPARVLNWLAPLSAAGIAWTSGTNLRNAAGDLFRGEADAATALGLHLMLDLIVVSALLVRSLERWARRRDDRARKILAAYLVAVIGVTALNGFREAVFRHKETVDLIELRQAVLRRSSDRPFVLAAVVGGASPETVEGDPSLATARGGRLRFVLQTTLPDVRVIELSATDELLNLPETTGPRLVILVGSSRRLSYAFQSKLGLEAIHLGITGALDAYATARPSERP